MGNRTTGLDTHHEPVASLRRQRSVTVGHGSGAFSCQKDDSASPMLTAQQPKPYCPHPRLQPHDPQHLGGEGLGVPGGALLGVGPHRCPRVGVLERLMRLTYVLLALRASFGGDGVDQLTVGGDVPLPAEGAYLPGPGR